MKKTLGILFILISIPLIVILFSLLITSILPEVRKLLSDFNAYQLGTVMGSLLFAIIIAAPTLLLFIYDIKWVQLPFRKTSPTQIPEFPSRITPEQSEDSNSSI
ncbi:hypothetical protein VRU48_14645 [Pedobacter sp. KR3-3]|uniref:Uncharacterized protein n=1 Tax=Pedobacter albus TaxID=3113905 RepID=A0ABU7IA67_9SPHI|nr:hypothetical protein [Pedobacter sp. KR3-3]MEE1946360.1 hypothetical protein [Pedobacter sp. KR3-3]